MLINIPAALETSIDEICAHAPISKLRAITNLLQAYADSKHIIIATPAICRIFEECPRLSAEHRAVAKKIRNKFSELAALISILPTHAEIQLDGTTPTTNNGVWRIPIDWVASNGLSETHLICEDLYDCKVSHEAGRDFLSINNLAKLELTLDYTPGGGGNTHRVLQSKAVDSQRISVCIVDSDRICPSAHEPLGSTADLCLQVTGSGIYQLIISTGRELENHLPSRLVDKVRALWQGRIPSEEYAHLSRLSPEVTLFADLKSGLNRKDLDNMTGAANAYWDAIASKLPHCAVRCCSPNCQVTKGESCRQPILQPLGRTLLKEAGEYLQSAQNRHSPRRHKEYIPSPNDVFWNTLGTLVASYGISMKVTPTI